MSQSTQDMPSMSNNARAAHARERNLYRSRDISADMNTSSTLSGSVLKPNILNAIYRFVHCVPESSQDKSTLQDSLGLFDAFVNSLELVDYGDDSENAERMEVDSRNEVLVDERVEVVENVTAGDVDIEIDIDISMDGESGAEVSAIVPSVEQALIMTELESTTGMQSSVQTNNSFDTTNPMPVDAADHQSQSFFESLPGLEDSFTIPEYEQPGFKTADGFSSQEVQSLKTLLRQLRGTFSRVIRQFGETQIKIEEKVAKWFLEYGCVLVIQKIKSDVLSLKLVFPDAWEFESNSFPFGATSAAYGAKAAKESVIECGHVQSDQLDKVLENIKELMKKASTITGDERSAASGKQGHQRTPSFVRAIIEQAIIGDENLEVLPRGGSTDVGLHTGGRARETVVPCIVAVLRFLLPSDESLIQKFFAHFHMFVLDKLLVMSRAKVVSFLGRNEDQQEMSIDFVSGGSDGGFSVTTFDEVFKILSEASNLLIHLADDGFDVEDSVLRCSKFRKEMDRQLNEISRYNVKRSRLNFDNEHPAPVAATIPKLIEVIDTPLDFNEVKSRALANTHWYPTMTEMSALTNFEEVKKWIMHSNFNLKPSMARYFLRMSQVQELMFAKTSLLSDPSIYLPLTELEALLVIVTEYQTWFTNWLASPDSTKSSDGGLMFVQLRSLETLVVWIAFCLVHKSNVSTIPLMQKYGIPLDPTKLRNLSLDSKLAVTACLNVCRYLTQVNKATAGALFYPDSSQSTLDFARSYATNDEEMLRRWEEEKIYAEARKQEFEKKVEDKRVLVRSLESTLRSMETELQTLSDDRDTAEKNYQRSRYRSAQSTRDHARSAYNRQQNLISNQHRQIKEAKRCPPFVVEPLPKGKNEALTVIFFFMMPRNIGIMNEVLHLAQGTLVPRAPWHNGLEIDNEYMIAQEPRKHTWLQHYDIYANPSSDNSINGAFDIRMHWYKVPQNYGPEMITTLYNVSECIWYPTFSSVVDTVSGFYPNNVNDESVTNFFTQRLPPSMSDYQYMLDYPADSSHEAARGNFAYAHLHKLSKLDDCDKRAFVNLSSIRSFPCQQIRKIINFLGEEQLPLRHNIVQTVLRMAVYQLGELGVAGTSVEPIWKEDLTRDNGLIAARSVFRHLASQLRDTPRNHPSIVLIGELSSFLSQFDDSKSIREVRKSLADIALLWVQIKREEAQRSTTTPERRLELRGQECQMAAYGILSFGKDFLDEWDVGMMMKLVTIFQNCSVFASSDEWVQRLEPLKLSVANVMSFHCRQIVQIVNKSTSNFIDPAIREVLQHLPMDLVWFNSSSDSFECTHYEATDLNGNHYLVNALDGCLLVNGRPPSGLPNEILCSALYQKHFGKRDFEVTEVNGVFRSNSQFDGYFYQFSARVDGGDILIREIEISSGDVYELLDFQFSTRNAFWSDLPIRLQTMHSHWYCSHSQRVLFRPIAFNDKSVDFIGVINEVSEIMICEQVNENDRGEGSWRDPSVNRDRFVVINQSNVFRVLQKFENSKFIHTLQMPNDTIRYHLPRLNLNVILSVDGGYRVLTGAQHRGFVLAEYQTLEGFLPFFDQYLVLAAVDIEANDLVRGTRILVPDGKVVNSSDTGRVFIDLDMKPASQYHVNDFSLHSRLCTWTARTIESRFQLAAIFTAAGTMIPDPALKMTGSEAAINLIRQSWVNRPLTIDESQKLFNVMEFAHREPALRIICASLFDFSQKLKLLFRCESSNSSAPTLASDQPNLAQTTIVGDSATFYRQSKLVAPFFNGLRRGLTAQEHAVLIGSEVGFNGHRSNARESSALPSAFEESDSIRQLIHDLDNDLKKMIHSEPMASTAPPDFPHTIGADANELELQMEQDLKESWHAHHRREKYLVLEANHHRLAVLLDFQLRATRERRESMELAIMNFYDTSRSALPQLRLGQLANFIPSPTLADIAKTVCDPLMVMQFQRLLDRDPATKAKVKVLWKTVVTFLELCVFEDKLTRIQAMIAKTLKDSRVVRVTVLSSLLREAVEYLHIRLTASLLNLHVYELPFNRQVKLTRKSIYILRDTIQELQCLKGCFVVAPEYRLSLQLKGLELLSTNVATDMELGLSLESMLSDISWRDLVDEVDAVLHFKYQLNYAVGTVGSLDNGRYRWQTLQGLFKVLNESTVLLEFLSRHGLGTVMHHSNTSTFKNIRFTEAMNHKSKAGVKLTFLKLWVNELFNHSPFGFEWITDMLAARPQFRDTLIKVVTDETIHITDLINPNNMRDPSHLLYILCLRGWFGLGLITHVLGLRHGVNFGNDVRRKKRLAVPYKAADVPAAQSEFSHPDVGIAFTIISYYSVGITEKQLREALVALLKLAPASQTFHYSQWFNAVRMHLLPEDALQINGSEKIDLSNHLQFELLFKTFHLCTSTIDFWLDTCVFPIDTQQYPFRLSASAWDLANTGCVIGFSGTNETKLLLPLQVKQNDPDVDLIKGTNGYMIDCLMKYTERCEVLTSLTQSPDATSVEPVIQWKAVLELCLELSADALIDSGSLLAGVSTVEISEFLLKHPRFPSKFRGIVYFDIVRDRWMVLESVTSR
ncbi:hypothetical protein HDU76_002913 [Blyttiomyces sp. JEL0837]|nr:hypothetical protein HDU76_002913 [Blyttiomyces sp. JEL0837]